MIDCDQSPLSLHRHHKSPLGRNNWRVKLLCIIIIIVIVIVIIKIVVTANKEQQERALCALSAQCALALHACSGARTHA